MEKEQVTIFDSNFNHAAVLVYIDLTDVEVLNPILNVTDIIDIDNDGNMETLIHLPAYEGLGYVSILKYRNGKIEGETNVETTIKP